MDADKLLTDWADVTSRAHRPPAAPKDGRVPLAGPVFRLAGVAAMALVLVAAIAVVAPRQGGPSLGGGVAVSPSASPAMLFGPGPRCSVTVPNQAHTTGWPASDLDHGVDGLYTVLFPDGIMPIPPDGIEPDGTLDMKMVFFRDPIAAGRFTVTGRRLDGIALPLRADTPDGYGESGVQATGLRFPSEGCWEITVTSGPATLTFVTQVARTGGERLRSSPSPDASTGA